MVVATIIGGAAVLVAAPVLKSAVMITATVIMTSAVIAHAVTADRCRRHCCGRCCNFSLRYKWC